MTKAFWNELSPKLNLCAGWELALWKWKENVSQRWTNTGSIREAQKTEYIQREKDVCAWCPRKKRTRKSPEQVDLLSVFWVTIRVIA